METVVQGRRPKRRRLDRVWDDIKENVLSWEEGYDRATWMRMSSYHISGNKMKRNNKLR